MKRAIALGAVAAATLGLTACGGSTGEYHPVSKNQTIVITEDSWANYYRLNDDNFRKACSLLFLKPVKVQRAANDQKHVALVTCG